MSPDDPIAVLTAKVDALTLLVHQQGQLLAAFLSRDAATSRADPDDRRRRRRYAPRECERLAAELTVIVRRLGGHLPDDATLAGELGVRVKTFGKWRRDGGHPLGRVYAALVRMAATLPAAPVRRLGAKSRLKSRDLAE